MNVLGLISQLIGIKTLRLTQMTQILPAQIFLVLMLALGHCENLPRFACPLSDMLALNWLTHGSKVKGGFQICRHEA